jgi:small-conductance mechanosensitive channel
VSGIILIFEKPFEIGDFIELADRKGKIQEIGIRSSRMLTQQGSQVVIPNADLISNRFVNWTINTAYIKSELLFKVPMATDLNKITEIVGEEIRQSGHGVENMPPEILINAVSADTMELKVQVWITSVYIEAAFKSQLFAGIITRLSQAEIKIM